MGSDVLVLRGFFDFEVPFRAFFRRVFDRTFHRVFTLVRVAVLGALRVLVFILDVGLVQFVIIAPRVACSHLLPEWVSWVRPVR